MRLGRQLHLAHRHEVERPQLADGALRLRIEAADRFQRVAEEVQPHRRGHARRVEVDDAAAHGVFAGLAHGRGAQEAVGLQPAARGRSMSTMLPGAAEKALARDALAPRHALQDGVDRGGQDARLVLARSASGPAAPAPSCASRRRRRWATRGHRAGSPRPGRTAPRSRARRRRARSPAAPGAARRAPRTTSTAGRSGPLAGQRAREVGRRGCASNPSGAEPTVKLLCWRDPVGGASAGGDWVAM